MATIQSLTLANTFADLLATVNVVIHELNTNVLKIGDAIENPEGVIVIAEQVVTDSLTVGSLADLRGDVTANANVSVAGTLTTNRLSVVANATINALVVNTSINTNNVIVAGTLTLNGAAINTTAVPEGSQLYYTDARTRSAISNGAGLGYNSGTGVITNLGVTSLVVTAPITTTAAAGNITVGINATPSFSSVTTGIVVANATVLAVGANAILNASALLIGNTSVNTVMNSTVLSIATVNAGVVIPAGKTITANGGVGNSGTVLMSTGSEVYWGTVVGGSGTGGDGSIQYWSSGASAITSSANLTFTGTVLSLGNTTVKSTINSTAFVTGGFIANTTVVGVGANVVVNTSAVFIGNSTINAVMSSTRLIFNNSTVVNSTVFTGTSYLANNSTYLNGQLESFYRDASNMNAGTLPSARISGDYSGITNVGTLGILSVAGNTVIGANVVNINTSSGRVSIGNTAANSSVTDALLSVRRQGNSFEFGAANDGFQSVVGAQTDGTPFIAFNCDIGTNNNTYRTRGSRTGAVVRADSGNVSFSYVGAANTNNQTPLEIMRISGSAGSISANASLRCDTAAGRFVLPVGTDRWAV